MIGRYPHEVVDVVDAMGAALREPLTRGEILERLAAAGVPRFSARVAMLG